MMRVILSFTVSLPVFSAGFILPYEEVNGKATLAGVTFTKCPRIHCNFKKNEIDALCGGFGDDFGILVIENGNSCVCSCSGVFSHLIILLEQISLTFQQTKSLRRLTTTLRKNINTLDLNTLKTMFTNMKQDFSDIQKMMTASNQGTAESWQEIYEYIDNVIKLNPSVDSKSNIHQQIETTLKLIELKSASISKSLAQIEAEIYSKTLEKLNDASETAKKYFLPQLEAIHEANQELLRLN